MIVPPNLNTSKGCPHEGTDESDDVNDVNATNQKINDKSGVFSLNILRGWMQMVWL